MKVINQNTFETWPLEDKSIQSVITSPPYWALRKYDISDIVIGGKENCDHNWNLINSHKKTGGIGTWKSNDMPPVGHYNDDRLHFSSDALVCRQCNAFKGQYGLEPDYKMFVNHTLIWCKEVYRVLKDDGIFFLNMGDSYGGSGFGGGTARFSIGDHEAKPPQGLKMSATKKCKLLIPHRVAIRLIDDLGFICRNDIIWEKINAMPESVKDRLAKRYENIFFFVKKPKYYSNFEAVKIPLSKSTIERATRRDDKEKTYGDNMTAEKATKYNEKVMNGEHTHKNPGDVLKFTTQPSPFKHYAMFPEAVAEFLIKCSTRPDDLVLDPFAGSGTTLKVAEQLGRRSIGFDIGYEDIRSKRFSEGIQKELIL